MKRERYEGEEKERPTMQKAGSFGKSTEKSELERKDL